MNFTIGLFFSQISDTESFLSIEEKEITTTNKTEEQSNTEAALKDWKYF